MARIVVGQCFGCFQLFEFDPEKVPCVTIQKKRNPVCVECVVFQLNPRRKEKGLPPIEILHGAYG
jgi:hypothetical protein